MSARIDPLPASPLLRPLATAALPSEFGDFRIVAFDNPIDGREHIALVMGDVEDADDVLVRMHSECLTGDVLGSLRCDCRAQLHAALERIAEAGRGVLLYLRQEGRGIGLTNKVRAYALQDGGLDTVDANHALGFPDDLRDYRAAAAMLDALGVKSVALMTNNPNKLAALERYGVALSGRVEHEMPATAHNVHYLQTKRDRSGHLLDVG
ncbi:MAG: GTP cyclohydrolase II [Alphaproteobacteria bacterium]|nr:GTP cyclohydrolase II [Alphaproteobacteria bacterium]